MILLCGANERSTRARARVVVLLSGRYVIVIVARRLQQLLWRREGTRGGGAACSSLASWCSRQLQQRYLGGWQQWPLATLSFRAAEQVKTIKRLFLCSEPRDTGVRRLSQYVPLTLSALSSSYYYYAIQLYCVIILFQTGLQEKSKFFSTSCNNGIVMAACH